MKTEKYKLQALLPLIILLIVLKGMLFHLFNVKNAYLPFKIDLIKIYPEDVLDLFLHN